MDNDTRSILKALEIQWQAYNAKLEEHGKRIEVASTEEPHSHLAGKKGAAE